MEHVNTNQVTSALLCTCTTYDPHGSMLHHVTSCELVQDHVMHVTSFTCPLPLSTEGQYYAIVSSECLQTLETCGVPNLKGCTNYTLFMSEFLH